jgi:AAA+ superfamily predicted ATPase
MKILFPLETLKALVKAGCKSQDLSDANEIYRGMEIDSREIVPSDFPIIKRILGKEEFSLQLENRRILKKLKALEDLKGSASDKTTKTLKVLELIPEAIRDIIGQLPNKWIFRTDDVYGALMPYFVEDAEYKPAERSSSGYSPAKVIIQLRAISRGEEDDRTITLHKADLKGTLAEILGRHNAIPETPELVKDYEADLKYYKEHHQKTGDQYSAIGRGRPDDSSIWSRKVVNLERDGRPTKVVMDDLEDLGEKSGYTQTDFWSKARVKRRDSDENEESFPLPVHPVVSVFSLESHEFVNVHITSLKPYEYDSSMVDKIVLPEDHKRLIGTLTKTSADRLEDIVRGKAAGVIILCSGVPGTGKTLTAEIYSEVVKRPLYAVQCAQLGTDEEELEKELSEVLDRAARWKAPLLIDEADVYIHERGEDIQQNAIVGVFLRLLEYFRGIMFMATNRATVVDDAILSRVTAHVRYTPPKEEDKIRKLWSIQALQFGAVNLDLDAAIKAFPGVSGRSVRQLIRLSAMTHPPKEISVKTLQWAAKFYDFPELLPERKEKS